MYIVVKHTTGEKFVTECATCQEVWDTLELRYSNNKVWWNDDDCSEHSYSNEWAFEEVVNDFISNYAGSSIIGIRIYKGERI